MTSDRIVKPTDPDALILEAWGQGFMVGSLLIMAAITVANMKSHILLHKLIFAELILAMAHGTFIFPHAPVYGWYLSVTAIGLNISWALHNVIAWMKNRPFLSKKVSLFYIVTVILCWPYWGLEIYANFTYFNNINKIFLKTRPLEPLFRDPWWIFTTVNLFWTIKREYDFGLWELIFISPRFGIMLAAMCLSIVFMVVDTCSVLNVFSSLLPTGVEPFWKLSFIFKCLCDTVILDDFKTALDHMRTHWMHKKNGELFITPLTTPNHSPRAHRVRREVRDVESTGPPSPRYSFSISPTKKPYARAVHMDHIQVREEICVHEERFDGGSREHITISEEVPDIPLRKL